MRATALDAVTVDAHGTLLTLTDPAPRLQQLLPEYEHDAIERAFTREAAYYREHAGRGRDAATLRELREDCVGVFNGALGSSLSADDYVGALHFEVLPSVGGSLERLRALGLSLAVVANWDYSLHERLAELGLAHFFAAVVPAAGKPSPDGIRRALDELAVEPARTLHVGDDETDERAARAAGVAFAYAPLPRVVARLA